MKTQFITRAAVFGVCFAGHVVLRSLGADGWLDASMCISAFLRMAVVMPTDEED